MRTLAALFALLWLLVPFPATAADLVVWHAYRGAEERALQQVSRAFQLESGHTVRLVPLSFAAFDAKVETAIPRGNGPDVFLAAHGNLGKWSAMGLIEPALRAEPGAHREPAVEAVTWRGRVMGQPLAVKSVLLLYDPSVVSSPPRTTDELLALMEQLSAAGTPARYGLVYENATPYFHAAWMHGFGGAALDVDGNPTLNTPAQIEALKFAKKLGEGMPLQPTGEKVAAWVRDGHAPMVLNGPWMVADIARPLAAAPLPVVSATGQPARPYLTVEAAFVAQGTTQAEAAHQFAAFVAGPRGAVVRQEEGGQAVTWRSVVPTHPILQAQLAQAAVAIPLPTDPDVQAAWEGLARALRQVHRGVDPERAALAAQTHVEVLIRPPPPPVSPWPWMIGGALLVVGGLFGIGWRLRDPSLRESILRHLWDYAWIGPATLALAVLVVVPFVTGAAVSLFAHRGGTWTFVGAAHFIDILLARDWPITSPMSFFYTLGVTVAWTVANVTLHVALGVMLALLLREPWVRLRGMWRALLILPWAVPNYITALIWKTLFDAQMGAINQLLGVVTFQGGPAPIDWFGSFATSFTANLVTNTWLGFPFMMVVTLGALQSIPRDLEEAAEVDGANAWQRFRHVTWPMLQPALLPAVILGSVWTFNMFNVIYLVSAGEPDGSTEILISEAYRWAFSRGNRYGYAAAYAVLIFGVLLVYARAANRIVGRKVL
jgi:arabinogalactan oligomer/maltooligosaccharide transport system permease protein